MYKTPRQCPRTPDDGLPHIGMERFIESTQFRGVKRLTVVMMFVGGGGVVSVLKGIHLLFLPYKTYPNPKNRGIPVNESRNKYVILECHTKQVVSLHNVVIQPVILAGSSSSIFNCVPC